jgi:hypothetical protein
MGRMRQCEDCLAVAPGQARRSWRCSGCQLWDHEHPQRGACLRCRYEQHLGVEGLCRGCVLAVRTERATDTALRFPAPTQLRLLFPAAACWLSSEESGYRGFAEMGAGRTPAIRRGIRPGQPRRVAPGS